MGLIASLPEIDTVQNSVFIMHEKSEKLIPMHEHKKGQLSYVEGGLAYITVEAKTYIVPAHNYFWIPAGIEHKLKMGHSATVLRSLYFYTHDDQKHTFYQQLGIYPACELLIQMINYTEKWDGKNICIGDENSDFLTALKNLLPQLNKTPLPMVLPMTEDERLLKIITYLENHLDQTISLARVSKQFTVSERTLSRLFQSNLHISFLQYLTLLRMIKGLELLLKTNKPISEIAYAVGYDTLGAFSNTFKVYMHICPSKLRHENKMAQQF
jgi:AraC-like DNA-binding protein/quercetin dioxygenase-like cupin family protein